MDEKNLVPKNIAFFCVFVVPVSFVAYTDFIKKLAASKIKEDYQRRMMQNMKADPYKNEIEVQLQEKYLYREKELKFFLPYSLIYIVSFVAIFWILGPYINFPISKIYFSPENNNSITDKAIKTVTIIIINFVLYSGLLIQFIIGNEIMYPKTPFCYFMENIYGPFLEESIYRGLLYTLCISAGYGGVESAIISSATFSLSHLRHVFDVYFHKSMIPSLFFQILYTFLFGIYTCYGYNYSGTIIAAILLHSICNTLQTPRLGYLSDPYISKFKKNVISFTYIIGILGWILLIKKFH